MNLDWRLQLCFLCRRSRQQECGGMEGREHAVPVFGKGTSSAGAHRSGQGPGCVSDARLCKFSAMFVCALVAAGWITALAAKSDPHPDAFDCHELICGMPAHDAYPHFVIGRVAALADAGQAKQLFNGMRRRGKWSALPTDGNLFWDNLQPVAIDAGPGVTVITLTSQAEMHAAPLHVGDFVRYSPHRGRYEVPPTSKVAAAYWHIDGCVAILCRAGDGRCSARYVSGVYRASDGAQLSPVTLVPLRRGVTIDTETMFPKRIKKTN